MNSTLHRGSPLASTSGKVVFWCVVFQTFLQVARCNRKVFMNELIPIRILHQIIRMHSRIHSILTQQNNFLLSRKAFHHLLIRQPLIKCHLSPQQMWAIYAIIPIHKNHLITHPRWTISTTIGLFYLQKSIIHALTKLKTPMQIIPQFYRQATIILRFKFNANQ